jgi:transcriptional regulator GlxA family with amidase domain
MLTVAAVDFRRAFRDATGVNPAQYRAVFHP